MNTREDNILDWGDDRGPQEHGPQKRPASLGQIKAAQNQVVADAINAKSQALPDVFVCFISGKDRSRRYTRINFDNWDVHIWLGQWQFYDNIGNRSVVEDFEEALHVFEVRSCNERRH